jgi:hypothetical protein
MKGETLGAFLLALMIFSFSVSLIPLSYMSYGSSGEIVRFEGKRIEIRMDFGILEFGETNGSEPYAVMRGSLSYKEGKFEGSIGSISIYIPENWKGSVRVTMSSGIVALNGSEINELDIKMGLGLVQGEMIALKRVLIDMRTGAVRLMLRVRESSGAIVKLNCDRFYLRYDGGSLRGENANMTLWEGELPLQVVIRTNIAELDVIRMKG